MSKQPHGIGLDALREYSPKGLRLDLEYLERIRMLLDRRAEARKKHDFLESDRISSEIRSTGFNLGAYDRSKILEVGLK